MELRQLQYFVTLADELHFGRAAAREHIVQSALSQQLRRLERELGVMLVERDTHHVRLTAAGSAMLAEAQAVLRAVHRATKAAQAASTNTEIAHVSVLDASLDTMPTVLRYVESANPGLIFDRIEARVPSQYRMLAEGALDIGFGSVSTCPPGIANEVVRLDRIGVLIPDSHPLAAADDVPLDALEDIPLVVAENVRGADFNDFFAEFCRHASFQPILHHGRVQSFLAAESLVTHQRCAAIVPGSCDLTLPGTCWLPITPVVTYPWSLLWLEDNRTPALHAVRAAVRELQVRDAWLGGVGAAALRKHRRHALV